MMGLKERVTKETICNLKRSRGATFIEMALAIPIVLLVVLGIIYFSAVYTSKGVIATGAQRALSQASVDPGVESTDAAELLAARTRVKGKVRQTVAELLGNPPMVEVDYDNIQLILPDDPASPLPMPKPDRVTGLRNFPMQIVIPARVVSPFPFFPSFPITIRTTGYHEIRAASSQPGLVDCCGSPFNPVSPPSAQQCTCYGLGKGCAVPTCGKIGAVDTILSPGNCECRCANTGNPPIHGLCECPAPCPAPKERIDPNDCNSCRCPYNPLKDPCISSGGSWTDACNCACPFGSPDPVTGLCPCGAIVCTGQGASRKVVDPTTCQCVCPANLANACASSGGNWDDVNCHCSCPGNTQTDPTNGGVCACPPSTQCQVAGQQQDPVTCLCSCPPGQVVVTVGNTQMCGCNPATAPVCSGSEQLNSSCQCSCPNSAQNPGLVEQCVAHWGVWNASHGCDCTCPVGQVGDPLDYSCHCPTPCTVVGQIQNQYSCACECPTPQIIVGSKCSCDPGLGSCQGGQSRDLNDCSCKCPNASEASSCTANGGKWDSTECSCRCPDGKEGDPLKGIACHCTASCGAVPSGQVQNPADCSCACPAGQVDIGGVCKCPSNCDKDHEPDPYNQCSCVCKNIQICKDGLRWNPVTCECDCWSVSCPVDQSPDIDNRCNCECDLNAATCRSRGGPFTEPNRRLCVCECPSVRDSCICGSQNASTCACDCPAGSTLDHGVCKKACTDPRRPYFNSKICACTGVND